MRAGRVCLCVILFGKRGIDMKRFLKRLMLGVVTLALFCCMTPLAFADDPTYYTVYLEPQGGVGVSTQIFVYKNSSNVYRATNLPSPTLDGYTFDGWYDDMVGGEKITTRYEFKADGQTIYAHWTVDESKSTSTKPAATPAATPSSEKSFQLKDHMGTILVAGTTLLIVTLVAMNS